MEFLLFLSALMSAVTGAFAGPRGVEARLDRAEAQMISFAQIAAPARAAVLRPAQELPSVFHVRRLVPERPPGPVRPSPLAKVRLVE